MIKIGIPHSQIEHVPIFIDPDNYIPEFISQPYLVYFGRLSREKGLPLLLEVMSSLKHHNLLIVGDGPQRQDLEAIKEKKNLVNVRFMGKLHGVQLNRIIRNSRFVVVPSTWYENSPNVLLEAYALGKPVLGANIGGIPEYIDENINGLLYEYNNLEDLKEKIDFLMTQQVFCEEMGRSARKIVQERYDPITHYNKIQKIFKSITSMRA